jgi:hypothetical protein
VVKLSSLTDKDAVTTAVQDFDRVGRALFLESRGFEPSRDCFLQIGSALYDTKPIVAAAYAALHS